MIFQRWSLIVLFLLIQSSTGNNDEDDNQEHCQHNDQDSETCINNLAADDADKRATISTSTSYNYDYFNLLHGSAQAYKPYAPIGSTICEENDVQSSTYRILSPNSFLSTWRRRTKFDSIPKVVVRGTIYDVDTCNIEEETTACQKLIPDTESFVEVWQPNPNGVYSPISPSNNEESPSSSSSCRAQVPINTNEEEEEQPSSSFQFHTYAPGCIGSMMGLGPNGFDLPPWTHIPTIHLLISIPKYHLILTEIPISEIYDNNHPNPTNPLQISSYEWDTTMNELTIDVDIYLKTNDEWIDWDHNPQTRLRNVLCSRDTNSSSSNGGEDSYGDANDYLRLMAWHNFFNEPISLCQSTMLDFYPL